LLFEYFDHELVRYVPAIHPRAFIRDVKTGRVYPPLLYAVLALSARQTKAVADPLALTLALGDHAKSLIPPDAASFEVAQALYHLAMLGLVTSSIPTTFMGVGACSR
jgi:hypothetical protein